MLPSPPTTLRWIGRAPLALPDGTNRERVDRSQDVKRIANAPWEDWSAIPVPLLTAKTPRARREEAILQVRATSLCGDQLFIKHLRSRPGCPFTRRPRSPQLVCDKIKS